MLKYKGIIHRITLQTLNQNFSSFSSLTRTRQTVVVVKRSDQPEALNETIANKAQSCVRLQSIPHFLTTLSFADIPALTFTGTAARLPLSTEVDLGPEADTDMP